MRNWQETERRKAGVRRAKAATATSTVGISKRPGGGGGRGERGGVMRKRLNLGLAIIVLKFVGLPMAVTRLRKTVLTSSICCVFSPVPLMMHLTPSMSPMPP